MNKAIFSSIVQGLFSYYQSAGRGKKKRHSQTHDSDAHFHDFMFDYLGVYALLDRLHVVTLSQSLPDTELRGEF